MDQPAILTDLEVGISAQGLSDMQRACLQVKVRSVGANGAGHSPWSEPVTVTVPGRPEAPPPPPSVSASDASEAPKRRRKKAAHDRELEQADPKRSKCPLMLLQLFLSMCSIRIRDSCQC